MGGPGCPVGPDRPPLGPGGRPAPRRPRPRGGPRGAGGRSVGGGRGTDHWGAGSDRKCRARARSRYRWVDPAASDATVAGATQGSGGCAAARAGSLLRLHIIDGALFPEVAQDAKVQAVPTLILDDHWRWSGRIPVTDVLEQLATRDPSRLSADALDGIIKEGRAEAVARAMIEKATLFPGIIDLLVHDKWPARLGAMVVMETIAEADPPLAARVVPLLQARYDRLDDPARGDVLYVIGETGDHQAVPFLQKIAAHSTNPEIRQAASEALAALETT